MTRAEVNAHYAKLNDRFEGRAARLRRLGFVYGGIPGYEAAAFTKPRKHSPHRSPITVQASEVMHADDICWAERIAELEDYARIWEQ